MKLLITLALAVSLPLVAGPATNPTPSGATLAADGTGLVNPANWRNLLAAEAALGLPATTGYFLSSTSTGVRSWAQVSAASISGLGTLATQSGTFSGTSSGTNTGDQTNITGTAATATKLATARTIAGQSFDGSANISITAANVGAVATSGAETVAGDKTLSGQVQLTGQSLTDANSAVTAGTASPLRPALRGTAWDIVSGGIATYLGPIPAPASSNPFYGASFGPMNVSNDVNISAGNSVRWFGDSIGLSLQCLPSGVSGANAISAWFSAIVNVATRYPAVFNTTPTKAVRVLRLIIPTAANRSGRRYQITGFYSYANAIESGAGTAALSFIGMSNALECRICTAYPSSYTSPQTVSGAVAAPATGTFSSYAISDATREILVRSTIIGSSQTIQIAPYSETPSWTTVLSLSGGIAFPCAIISVDGTATGAAAAQSNALSITEIWEAIKF